MIPEVEMRQFTERDWEILARYEEEESMAALLEVTRLDIEAAEDPEELARLLELHHGLFASLAYKLQWEFRDGQKLYDIIDGKPVFYLTYRGSWSTELRDRQLAYRGPERRRPSV
jgi:hypothetical protein